MTAGRNSRPGKLVVSQPTEETSGQEWRLGGPGRLPSSDLIVSHCTPIRKAIGVGKVHCRGDNQLDEVCALLQIPTAPGGGNIGSFIYLLFINF